MNSKFELRPFYRCEYTSHTQLWVAVRPDLRFDWSLGPLRSASFARYGGKEAMASPFELEFGDSPFDGYPRNFADAKALIYARSKKAGVAWILTAGEGLLKAKGKLSSDEYADDAKMEESFNEDTDYFKRLPVIKMAACKRAIDTKSELFTGLNAQGKRDLQASTSPLRYAESSVCR